MDEGRKNEALVLSRAARLGLAVAVIFAAAIILYAMLTRQVGSPF